MLENKKPTITAVMVLALLMVTTNFISAKTYYKTYETISSRDEDGEVTSEDVVYRVEVNERLSPEYKSEYNVDKSISNSLTSPKRRPKKIRTKIRFDEDGKMHRSKPDKSWTYFQEDSRESSFNSQSSSDPNSIGNHLRQNSFRQRSVESPALSVDSGGARSNSPSVRLTKSFRKFFEVPDGHYTDAYKRIEKHKPIYNR